MEAAVIEKPDDSTVTLAPMHRMAKMKLQQELRVISTRRSLTGYLLYL
jgi:hypothetical protein